MLPGDDLREMHREAMRPDGLERLLRWLARRVGGSVVLLDGSGAPLQAFPESPGDVLDQVAADVKRVVAGEVQAAAADFGSGVAHVQAIGGGTRGATLVVARPERFTPSVRNMVGDAARLIELLWQVQGLRSRQQRVQEAETHTREAVLHLLIVGDVQAARRVAGALGPSLPDEGRVYIVEGPAGARDQTADYCDQASRGRAWIVRCPVYTRHVIVLAPPSNPPEQLEDALRGYADRLSEIDVGGSDTVALRDMASGYAQAFHALAVARGSAEHYARFSPRGDLAALLRPRGRGWARETLRPLTDHRPHRSQDPDSAELIATLRSWLDFYGGAARQMKIHRNTLASRLRHVEHLLGRPLSDIETQSTLHLALCLLDGPDKAEAPTELAALLDDPMVYAWADSQLSPLLSRDPELHLRSLRTWLDNNAHIEPTATALGISVPGTRKRLIRIETILGRSLLSGPSARYDLWFALNIHDG